MICKYACGTTLLVPEVAGLQQGCWFELRPCLKQECNVYELLLVGVSAGTYSVSPRADRGRQALRMSSIMHTSQGTVR